LPSLGSGVTVPPLDDVPPSFEVVDVPPSLLPLPELLPPVPAPPLPLPAEPLPALPLDELDPPPPPDVPLLPLPPLPDVPPPSFAVPPPLQSHALSVMSLWHVCTPVLPPEHEHATWAPAFMPAGHGDPFFESLPHAATTSVKNA
jgi:hypothetical protein